jgi:hypothetical protein
MFSKAISAASITACLSLAAVTARADDCATLMSATIASAHKSYSATSTTSGGGAPTRVGHSVSTGGKLFVEMNARWVLSKMTMSDMANEMRAEIGTAKMSCHRLGEETVGGEATTVYSSHVNNHGNVSDNRLWISKATGLPLKTEVKLQNGMQIVTVFDYAHSQAPEKFIKQP